LRRDFLRRTGVRLRKGDPLRESKLLTNVLQPATEAAGLGRVTWHQFRHIHSSLLNGLNVPVKFAQEQLGHTSIATTLNIYTHAVDASHRKAIEAVGRELFVVLDHSGLQTAAELESAPPVVTVSTESRIGGHRPGLNRGWRFCRFRRVLYLMDGVDCEYSDSIVVGLSLGVEILWFGECSHDCLTGAPKTAHPEPIPAKSIERGNKMA
jgi:hypothetical protein